MLEPEPDLEPGENEDHQNVAGQSRPYLEIPSQILWHNSSENYVENRENLNNI